MLDRRRCRGARRASAASLTTLARSAPDHARACARPPRGGRRRAPASPCARGPRRIASRPRRSGRSTTTWRSKRPGAQQRRVEDLGPVGGRHDDHALARRRSRPSRPAAGSASARARRGRRQPGAPPRVLPMASSSSMKTMQGAFSLACSNRSRTRAAPTPTNISTNSEPVMEKNGTPASPATARASSVLPVPGGPTSSTPLGMRPPSALVLLGVLEEVHHLLQLGLGLVDAGHVGEGRLELLAVVDLGLGAAEGQGLGGPPPMRRMRKSHRTTMKSQRHDPAEEEVPPERALDAPREFDLGLLEAP